MSSLFNRFSKFRRPSRSSSAPDLSPQSSSSSSTKPISAEQAAFQKAEVVIMVNGVAGPKAIVPLITTKPVSSCRSPCSPSPVAPPAGARLPITPISPAASPVPTTSKPLISESTLIPSTTTTLLALPNEILTVIAMKSGFFTATTLMLTCTRLYNLLNDSSTWTSYTRGGSSDSIESEVTICTKIHTFDHLVFGLWHDVAPVDQDASPSLRARSRSLSQPTSEPNIYFEHMTFNEQYDFLGGITLGMTPGGLISSDFFDHRETLPCYREALVEAVATGVLPASAPHGTPAPGAKIDHSCSRCAKYDGREVLKSLFVFDQVPYHPKWGREGFSWNYTYPDGRRTLKICIKPFQGVLGYTSVSDLPSLFINCITVDGKQLKGDLYDLFNRLVNGKEKKTVV